MAAFFPRGAGGVFLGTARALPGHRLAPRDQPGGGERVIDLSPEILGRGPTPLASLRDPLAFAQVFRAPDVGVEWANGAALPPDRTAAEEAA